MSRTLASAFAPIAARGLVRPAFVPPDIALVCIGGATLGGSGKTRVAIACARELALRHARVVFVGHAYRAAPPAPCVVSGDARVTEVGDEAVVCARSLAPSSVTVVVGPTRQAAIDHAVGLVPRPTVIVLDGPLRVRGRCRKRSLSILAVDANRPWGSGRLPPAGDLKAPRERLLAEADMVVPVDATPTSVRWKNGTSPSASIESLRGMRIGLFTAMARPDRLARALGALGVRPWEIVSIADHGPLSAAARARLLETGAAGGLDGWVGTAKCILHLDGVSLGASPSRERSVGILEADLTLPPALLQALAQIRSE